MQVVSGPIGKFKIHFEAPEAKKIKKEIRRFLSWANGKQLEDSLLRAAIAHLWFVTIHPFEDGNGRIARAIADMFLARSEDSSQRYYRLARLVSFLFGLRNNKFGIQSLCCFKKNYVLGDPFEY